MPPTNPLALRNVVGNLVFSPTGIYAWYVLPAQRWTWLSESRREQIVTGNAARYAALAGRRFHLRVTSRPYPAAEWARQIDADTPHPLPGWADRLRRAQLHLNRFDAADKTVYLGVRLGSLTIGANYARLIPDWHPRLTAWREAAETRETGELADALTAVTNAVTDPALAAKPASPAQLEWLLRRSIGLGLPSPARKGGGGDTWEPGDLTALTEPVTYEHSRYGYHVRVTGDGGVYGGEDGVTRWVKILSLSRMNRLHVPDVKELPWLADTDSLPFSLEVSAQGEFVAGKQVADQVDRKLRFINGQIDHYRGHDLPAPESLRTKAQLAARIIEEASDGAPAERTRMHGYVRFAVWGDTKQEADRRANQLASLYENRDWTLAAMRGPMDVLREFIPGEPVRNAVHLRRMSVLLWANGLPHMASMVGDGRGPQIGHTAGGVRRPVHFDTHHAPERAEMSGMVGVAGQQGAGKALALDTPLPTPTGWTTMGAVQVGDWLLGGDGRPTRVVAATDVMHGRPCYEVEFSDGQKIVADAEHQWLTRTRKAYRAQILARKRDARVLATVPDNRPGYCRCGCGARVWHGSTFTKGHRERLTMSDRMPLLTTHTTEQIAASLRQGDFTWNHAVPLTKPLDLPPADLPVDPYVLGAWLGDGNSWQPVLTCFDDEIVARIESTGQRVSRRPKGVYGLLGIGRQLRALGVVRNKHIPGAYLRASEQQRRDLLAGLLDTDGHCSKTGGIEIALTCKPLVDGLLELLVGLGYKPSVTTRRVKGRRDETSTCYRVRFTPDEKVFYLTRKAARQNTKQRGSSQWRHIIAVRPIESVPVRCVQVDNTDHLYLAGRGMVPTHNSVLMATIVEGAVARGIPFTVFDPSGPLAGLTRLPHLAGVSRVLELGAMRPGELNPFAVIAEPRWEDYADADEHAAAVLEAEYARKTLAHDITVMLLADGMRRDDRTAVAVQAALRAVGGRPTVSMWSIIDYLDGHSDYGRELAAFLRDRADMPMAGSFFDAGHPDDDEQADTLLTVITAVGLEPPPINVPRESWSLTERMAEPLLHLAAYRAARDVYSRRRTERKGIVIDEGHLLGRWGSGRALFARLRPDTRKYNAAAVIGSQTPADLLVDLDVGNHLSTAFVGRLEDPKAQADAMRMLDVPPGVGYEAPLGQLSPPTLDGGQRGPREFIMRDVQGQVEKIVVDLSDRPELLVAVNSTAGPQVVTA